MQVFLFNFISFFNYPENREKAKNTKKIFFKEQQYAKWMAACKLAAKGKTMADAGYLAEVENIRRLLDMQHPLPTQALPPQAVPQDLNPDDYLPQRCIRKFRSRGHSVQRILEAHAKVRELGLTDAKMQYLRAWQSVPEFGVHYFVIKLKQSRKPVCICSIKNKFSERKGILFSNRFYFYIKNSAEI